MSKSEPMVLDIQRTDQVCIQKRRRRRPQYVDASTSMASEPLFRAELCHKPSTFQLGHPQASAFLSFSSVNEFSSDSMDFKHESHESCGMPGASTPSPRASLPITPPVSPPEAHGTRVFRFAPTGSTKSRQRSKTGCVPCRVRKKKCDEARPVCGGCLKFNRGIECDYDLRSVFNRKKIPAHILRQILRANDASQPSSDCCEPASPPEQQSISSPLVDFRKLDISYLLNPPSEGIVSRL